MLWCHVDGCGGEARRLRCCRDAGIASGRLRLLPPAGELDVHAAGEGVGDALACQLHVHAASIGGLHTEEAAKEGGVCMPGSSG